MNSLKRIPWMAFAVLYLIYLSYDFYQFKASPDGETALHSAQVKTLQDELDQKKIRKKKNDEAAKTLEARREEIRAQARKLAGYQGSLSDVADVPGLIKVLLTEARKLEIRIDRIEPAKKNQTNFYLEQEFKLDLRGSYTQILLFIHRVSQMQRILRIGSVAFRASSDSIGSRAVTLASTLSVNAYQYVMSREDELSKDMETQGGGKK